MKHKDQQLGTPEKVYVGTKANIEAIAAPAAGMLAYATDAEQIWTYNGASWDWCATNRVATKDADYTVTGLDDVIICNKTTAITITLLAASGSGKRVTIKNIGAGLATVDGDSSDTIDGETTQMLSQWSCLQLVDYAANTWIII